MNGILGEEIEKIVYYMYKTISNVKVLLYRCLYYIKKNTKSKFRRYKEDIYRSYRVLYIALIWSSETARV